MTGGPDPMATSARDARSGPVNGGEGGRPLRRTQAQRRATTRRLLLDATIESLIEDGYAGLTTLQVAQRAGLSRGAQQHHYATKEELVTSAIEHLAEIRLEELQTQLRTVGRGRDRTRAALRLSASALSGPLFHAGLELWVAARTDGALRHHLIAVEQRLLGRVRETSIAIMSGDDVLRVDQLGGFVDLAVDTFRGAAIACMLDPEALPRRIDRDIDLLMRLVDALARPEA